MLKSIKNNIVNDMNNLNKFGEPNYQQNYLNRRPIQYQ